MLPWAGRRTRREQVPEYFKTLWPAFVAAQSEASIDKIVVDGADAVALGRFSLVVKANGRRFSMPVAFHSTVESGRLVRLHLYEDTDLVTRTETASG
ncbi:nuclear transport factor 2 family protein [Streptomyces sp. NPDC050564]|uniref:nuclear transport factor 2 family protein n=1 Tax=Streptomyces sp. NPDC050564 TaxID=3365631 RepID=UPI00379EFDA7